MKARGKKQNCAGVGVGGGGGYVGAEWAGWGGACSGMPGTQGQRLVPWGGLGSHLACQRQSLVPLEALRPSSVQLLQLRSCSGPATHLKENIPWGGVADAPAAPAAATRQRQLRQRNPPQHGGPEAPGDPTNSRRTKC